MSGHTGGKGKEPSGGGKKGVRDGGLSLEPSVCDTEMGELM